MTTDIWLMFGLILTVFGIGIYMTLYFRHRRSFLGMTTVEAIRSLLSHVPDETHSAGAHVSAGVLTTCGIALVVGGTAAITSRVPEGADRTGLLLTAAAFLFSVFISVVAFWTLWQTRRLEQMQGTELETMPFLVSSLNAEIDALIIDLRARKFVAAPHHRIYLVTTNPFLGLLSFPTEDFTHKFYSHLEEAAQCVRLCRENGSTFDLQLLCGSNDALVSFHQRTYATRGALAPADDPRVVEATDDTEKRLRRLTEIAKTEEIVARVRTIPKIQFAIVGNAVFEFVLDNQAAQTEIHRTRRIRERVMCDRFIETCGILKGIG